MHDDFIGMPYHCHLNILRAVEFSFSIKEQIFETFSHFVSELTCKVARRCNANLISARDRHIALSLVSCHHWDLNK